MKLFIILYFLVQTNAFRVPLPYGTGIPSSGQGIGNQGIFDLISTWFTDPDDNSVQVPEDTVSGKEFLDGFDQFVQEMQEMEEPVSPLPIQQVLEDSLLTVKKALLSKLNELSHHHLATDNSERSDFRRYQSNVRMARM